jgi:hypothetical protein
MNKVIYYILLILILGIAFFGAYTLSMLTYFSISDFHSSSPCHNFLWGNGYTKVELSHRYNSSILVSALFVSIIQLALYFLLKQKTQYYKTISIAFSGILFILIFYSIYQGKEAGSNLIEQCSKKLSITKPRREIVYPCGQNYFST